MHSCGHLGRDGRHDQSLSGTAVVVVVAGIESVVEVKFSAVAWVCTESPDSEVSASDASPMSRIPTLLWSSLSASSLSAHEVRIVAVRDITINTDRKLFL